MPVELRKDPAKNRMYITLSGLVSDEEARVGTDQLVELVRTLRSGFTAVTDLSTCRPLGQLALVEVRRAAHACREHGLLAAARVAPRTSVVHIQLQRVSTEEGYTTFTVTSVAEAERLLDEEVRAARRRAAQDVG
jgi:hypothetical protein